MNQTLSQQEQYIQDTILPLLRPYFDFVTFENRHQWLMKIKYGHKELFESFETYELHPCLEEESFEQKKIRLFMDGVILYAVHSHEDIQIVCNAYNEDYHRYR